VSLPTTVDRERRPRVGEHDTTTKSTKGDVYAFK
jgi:hypothetical protein